MENNIETQIEDSVEDDQFLSELYEFANIYKEPPKEKRETCKRCRYV